MLLYVDDVLWKGAAMRVILLLVYMYEEGTKESSCLGLQLQSGGKLHLRLNNGERPIAYKYREGKMQSRARALSKST